MQPPSDTNNPHPNSMPPPPSSRGSTLKIKSFISTFGLFLLAPLIAIMITIFGFQSYEVDGDSMENTLQNGDRLIVNKFPKTIARLTDKQYIPQRGDVIVFDQLGLYNTAGNEERQLIKRVIALPGERVTISNGFVKVFNSANPDGFNPDLLGLYSIPTQTTAGDMKVELESNEIFVLGDNRNNSADSRVFGPVPAKQVVGKLALRMLPLNKAQFY